MPPRKTTQDSPADEKAKLRALFKKKGLDATVFDRDLPRVSDVVQDQDNPFEFIGADADLLQSGMRLCQVDTPAQVERRKRQGYAIVADHRDGQTNDGGADVNLRGGCQTGVIMGQPLAQAAVYKAAARKRVYDRRNAKKVSNKEVLGSNPEHLGLLDVRTDYTPASVRDH